MIAHTRTRMNALILFLAGIIGPGLLVSSGNALAEGGPAGSLISFSLVGIIVFFVMYEGSILRLNVGLNKY